MPMDPQLAAIYGTNQDETDVEKLAAAELAEELAEGEEEEETELSDEQAEALAAQVLASEEEGAEVEEPEETEGEEMTEEQEKLSEADYLGRVMAHAYTQELRKIAADEQHGPKESFGGKVKRHAGRAWEAAKKAPGQYGRAMRGSGAGGWKGALGMGAGGKRAAQVWGARAGTAAVAGGAAYAAKKKWGKGKKKHSAAEPSALDILAERRALAMLEEAGIDPNAGAEQEKTSASEQEMSALEQAVEARAYALLQANGYIKEQE